MRSSISFAKVMHLVGHSSMGRPERIDSVSVNSCFIMVSLPLFIGALSFTRAGLNPHDSRDDRCVGVVSPVPDLDGASMPQNGNSQVRVVPLVGVSDVHAPLEQNGASGKLAR